jgi:flagellar biosynthetic protein FlhB
VLSAADYRFQRRRHLESLKMSRQEVKEERKQYEGDPLVRSRLRERQRQIMMRNIPQAVRKADVVITNPTHYAVALAYDRLSMASPQLTAKGVDMVALRIREVAREADVAVVENRPLARELYDNVDVGEFVPERYWNVVAAILGQIRKFRQEAARAG